ncbi:triose-phosphate isomerase [Parvularcula sp. IMCC14364]|uniref:triose-phosphate isomerase n=1 Tax=Parvularcula sp. IMCC14364 TaxID=3067902 RepID=UPI002740488D|nr:triose-phosphate isomerase [Parvularcula sp. IMCC14364]
MRHLIAGNWKMNGLKSSLGEVTRLKELLAANTANADVLICPPFTLISDLAKEANGTTIMCGAQDCHTAVSGAHTGDVSAEMLKEAGAMFIIVGHSERRADHGETTALVKQKAEAAQDAALTPIICVGETREERELGNAAAVVSAQLSGSLPEDTNYVVAYEPVWAIGTGLVPSLDDIREIHALVREKTTPDTRLLYGGSVKPANAAEILAIENVNGALVGGASLKADDFYGIIQAV